MTTLIEVAIANIEVDNYYYSFDYAITIDGEIECEGEYQSDHAWQDDIKGFKKMLKDNGAVRLALEQI